MKLTRKVGSRRGVRPGVVARGSRAAFVALAALAVSAALPAQRPEASRVDDLAAALMETARLPSLSIAILRGGEIEYARAFGYADLETRTPATPMTRYRCASVSKVITVTAIGRLVQQGRLDLDAPVSRYVPSWPAEPTITPRQLSGHLAGVSHYHADDRIDRSRYYESVTESLDAFRDSPRADAPGESYIYSTHGFTLLSAVAEGASGRPFLSLLEEDVFGPLGMTESGPDLRADPAPTMSTLYGRRGAEPVVIETPENPSYKWAGGGLVSSPSDLVRLAGAYLDGTLSPEVVEEMWTTQRTKDGEETGVGIAWRIGEDFQGRRIIHHSGSMGGARSTIVIWPEAREAIAVMTNVVWGSAIMETGLMLMEAYRVPAAPVAEGGGAGDAADGGMSRELAYTGEFTRGDETGETTGRLALEGSGGWIETPGPFAEWARTMSVERMPIRRIAGDRWALVSPLGAFPLELREASGAVTGVMALGSTEWTFRAEAAPGR